MIVQLEDVLGSRRAGEPAGHHRRASELAAQAAGDARAVGDATRVFAALVAQARGAASGAGHAAARAPARRDGAHSARDLPPAAASRIHVSRRDRDRAVPRASSASATSTARLTCARAPAARTATTSSTTDELNPEIGTRGGFRPRSRRALAEHGMGQMIDVVPNHMGVMGADNAWWLDVLENGPASAYADFFDIDWQPATAHRARPGAAAGARRPLRRGARGRRAHARVRRRSRRSFSVRYYEHRLPIDPREYPRILAHVARAVRARRRAPNCRGLPISLRRAARARRVQRERDRRARGRQGCAPAASSRASCASTRRSPRRSPAPCARSTASPANPRASTRLHELLEAQAYRLALLARRVRTRSTTGASSTSTTSPRCAWKTKRCSRRRTASCSSWLRAGKVDALRIDHPDGLYDPARLLPAAAGPLPPPARAGRVRAARRQPARPLYVVTEKIVAPFEDMPEVVGGARHDRLSLRQRGERPLRRHRGRARA